MSKKDDYILTELIKIRFADPISSVKLLNNFVIAGTMMGRINVYDIDGKKLIPLSSLNSENISDIAYDEKKNIFYIGIGDEEIKIYNVDQLIPESQSSSINIYESDLEHTNNCENAFIFITPESFFRIQIPQIDDNTLTIVETESEYDVKYFGEEEEMNKNEYIKYSLTTTNYFVPFDYDGKKFLWVEFMSSTNRNLCLADIPLFHSVKPYKYCLDKNIGHICQAKLLPNNRVFFVHSLNKCEIRLLDNKFTLLEQFTHIGEEVLACDIFINKDKNSVSNKKIDIISNKKKEELIINKKIKEEEINTNRNMNTCQNINKKNENNEEEKQNNEVLTLKQNIKKDNIVDINDIWITTLDIDGNVNVFKNRKEINLFNLYDINTISKDQKDKHFFSMGYAYYIRSNLNYFCVTSDHGCYIIKYNNNTD